MSLLDRLRTTIGDPYDIERELGGGGMSRVFLAEDVRLRRKVVVKVLSVVAARALEASGDRSGALAAARRRHLWNDISSPYFAAQLREEARLAALTGDHEGAIRAYRHYLALRSEPEPPVAAQVVAVRAELRRLERETVGQ
jgi:serine/threonine protein kinase